MDRFAFVATCERAARALHWAGLVGLALIAVLLSACGSAVTRPRLPTEVRVPVTEYRELAAWLVDEIPACTAEAKPGSGVLVAPAPCKPVRIANDVGAHLTHENAQAEFIELLLCDKRITRWVANKGPEPGKHCVARWSQ